MDSGQQAFLEEAQEILSELETALLELEENPQDMDAVGRVFRSMHTLKGSGAMFGFERISKFTHGIENVFDEIRSGSLVVNRQVVDLALASQDHVQALLEAARTGEEIPQEETSQLQQQWQALAAGQEVEVAAAKRPPANAASQPQPQQEAAPEPEGDSSAEQQAASSSEEEEYRVYGIRFAPQQDIMKQGTNPVSLLQELLELGEGKVVAQIADIPPLEELDAECCYVKWDIILTTRAGEDAIRDVFIFVEDDSEIRIQLLDAESEEVDPEDVDYKRLGDILVERGDLSAEQLQQVWQKRQRIGEMLVSSQAVSEDQVNSALAEQQAVRQQREKRAQQQAGSGSNSLRVPAERLDQLVDLVGELVTVQSRLSQTAL